jgi:hypothetical protein
MPWTSTLTPCKALSKFVKKMEFSSGKWKILLEKWEIPLENWTYLCRI